jgi:hypothetical protein
MSLFDECENCPCKACDYAVENCISDSDECQEMCEEIVPCLIFKNKNFGEKYER